jgi:hypothetical protein
MNKVFKKNIKIFIVIFMSFFCLDLDAHANFHTYINATGSINKNDSKLNNGTNTTYNNVECKVVLKGKSDFELKYDASRDKNEIGKYGVDLGFDGKTTINSIKVKFNHSGSTGSTTIAFNNINLDVNRDLMDLDIDLKQDGDKVYVRILRKLQGPSEFIYKTYEKQ